MLVTFHTNAFADITMFGDIAINLLRLMGHSGTVPGAIEPEDIPDALKKLKRAIAADDTTNLAEKEEETSDEPEEEPVTLHNRAYPLIQLLEAAEKEQAPVMWNG